MKKNGSSANLVNTGWVCGPYGVGHRIDISITRSIIDAILDGSLKNVEYEELPVFGLFVPKTVRDADGKILPLRNIWSNPKEWKAAARNLAKKFIENFENFTDNDEGKRLVAAGPKL